VAELNYMEIAAADAARAHRFWSQLLGWRFNGEPGPEQPYVMTQSGNVGIGLFESDEPGLWPYFSVASVEETARRVEELGGRIVSQGPVQGVGWHARCEDSEGNRFGLFQPDPKAPAPGSA
jgi:uncharacterized protein